MVQIKDLGSLDTVPEDTDLIPGSAPDGTTKRFTRGGLLGGALATFAAGVRVTIEGSTTVNGYNSLIIAHPPLADNDSTGYVFKYPDQDHGVDNVDYAEGNALLVLADADSLVTAGAPTPLLRTITGLTNATPVVITTSVAHGFSTGDTIRITGTGKATLDNKWWKIIVLSTTTFSLTGSAAPGSTGATGYAYTDRSPILGRWADTGIGLGGAMHIAPGLRGRSGQSLPQAGIHVEKRSDCSGIVITSPGTADWGPTPTSPYIQMVDARASSAVVFSVDSQGRTVHKLGSSTDLPITFVGETDTGIYAAADTLGFVAGAAIVFAISPTAMVIQDGKNINISSTTGTKIGQATTSKIGFWNATPVAKPTGVAVTAAGIHAALVSIGLIAA